MLRKLRALWARHSILEAKFQQEYVQTHPDQLRLSSLNRMQAAVLREITAIEQGTSSRGKFLDDREPA